jgi:signal transduction histidine kinase
MMAHEVNNSLGATNSIVDTVKSFLEEKGGEVDVEMAEALALAIDRHSSLSRFMHNFAEVVRLPKPQLDWVDLVTLVKDVAKLMRANLEEKDILLNFDDSGITSLKIRLDKKQIEQVLVNLIKNAKEAIDTSGQISLRLLKDPVQIIIADNGSGISPDVQEQLFTPFFSTKKDGQGVGLTLVREIVLNHGANINLTSREDGWTYCTITFQ